jgi:hypothetical protein
MSQFKHIILLIVVMISAMPYRLWAEKDVKIKILAVNPSASQTLETDVKQYLPEEVKPEDILELLSR